MYRDHFGLDQAPFSITPNLDFFFAGNKRSDILDALIYAVMNGDGIVKVTGEVGSGKTMLCRMLVNRLPKQVEIIYLINPTLTREQIIYTIASELGLPIHNQRVDEVLRTLYATLIHKHAEGKQVVLLIEEAQAMSLETLEEIRLISNLETAQHKLLQIVLFGQPELDEHLNLTKMRQLKERITNSFNVPPLTADNIPNYLMFRMRKAGYRGPDIFSAGAIKLIEQVSNGILRRISILADKSLLAAFADNSHEVKAKHVKSAIMDSEFPKKRLFMMNKKNATVGFTMASAMALLITAGFGWHLAQKEPVADKQNATGIMTSLPVSVSMGLVGLSTPVTAAPANPIQAEQAPTTTQPVIAPSVVTQPIVNNVSTFDDQLQQTTAWMQEQAPNRYSIQIARFSSGTPDSITHFLNQLRVERDLADLHVFASGKPNKQHFNVLYGSFATRPEAVIALNKLSEQLGYQPQLRTFGKIKREIDTTKQE